MGSRRRKTTTTRRREKTEYRPKEAARGPEMRPPEVPPEGPTLFLAMPPGLGTSGGLMSGARADGREQRTEGREKREETKWPPARFTRDLEGKEKREERREEGEERREKREEKRVPTRGRQRSPNEAAREGPTLFLAMPPGAGTSGGLKGREKRAEKRQKREEKREKIDFCCFS